MTTPEPSPPAPEGRGVPVDWDDHHALVIRYTPLVRRIARSLSLEIPGVFDFEDAVSSGMCGLVEAVGRYDPERGTNFHSFAVRRIRGAMIDAFRRMDRLSRTMRHRAQALDRAETDLELELGRAPTEEETARELGLPIRALRQTISATRAVTVSLDHLLERVDPENGSGERVVSIDAHYGDEDLSARVERGELHSHLGRLIRALPDRDRVLIALYYVECLSMREIATVLGISETRVSQRHAHIVRRLRAALLSHAA